MWPPPEQPRLADRLADPRWRWEHGNVGGAERLLMELVKQGLDERALPAAAALVVELDLPPAADAAATRRRAAG